MAKVSIIIPTLNERGYLRSLLTSIASQSVQPHQVIVADCGSRDNTAQDITEFIGTLPLVGMTTKQGVGRQRNVGARIATGDLLLFLDADVELGPHFIRDALREFTARKLDVACAYFYVDPGRPAFDRFGARVLGVYQSAFQFSRNPFGTGYCLLVKKTWHRKLGGFNEAYKHGEDHDYVKRAVEQGASFRFLKKCQLKVSNRRYESVGRFNLLSIYTKAEINRIFLNYKFVPREKPLYEFGNHKESLTSAKNRKAARQGVES